MQNQILKFTLLDNTNDTYTVLNPTKQQIFMLPKEESQMFPGRSYNYTGVIPAGYANDPATESENTDHKVNSTSLPYDASFVGTNYSGMSIFKLPAIIQAQFSDFSVYDPNQNTSANLFADVAGADAIRTIRNGLQMLKLPKGRFSTTLTAAADIAANGGSSVKFNYGQYLITISPKYIESTILSIEARQHFAIENMVDNVDDTDPSNIIPKHKRRNIYTSDRTNFKGTSWNFEQNQGQAGRLFGSVVEVWDATKTNLKQVKVMAENDFNWSDNSGNLTSVLYPDTFGYDTPDQDVAVGDVLRVYPRETYFDQIIIDLSYEDPQLQPAQALNYLLNDAVRDMNTGTIEIFDNNGFTVDPNTGNFDGTVAQKYQISQAGQYELRKKIKTNG